MNSQKILDNVLGEIAPSKAEISLMQKKTKEIISKLKRVGLKCEVGGSLAKGTIIKKAKQDIDIFVVFEKKNLDKFETKVKKTKLKYEAVHGSRDYFQIKQDNLTFELIPVLKFKKPEEAENVTDFSLIHVKYIRNLIKKNSKLANEIRLAKAFCHGQNCYGAESYIGGFSGYALEVLVCHYGGFVNFLKKMSRRDPFVKGQKDSLIIDPKKYFSGGKSEIFRELNQNKLQAPIILIDPTYKYRNVCAGLTLETFEIFLKSAENFLKRPSEELFKKKEFHLEDFVSLAKAEDLAVYGLDIKTDRQEGDIAGTKMKKFSKFILAELERKEQAVVRSKFVYLDGKEAKFYLAVKEKPLIEIHGPNKDMKEAVQKFKIVRKNVYFVKGIACAKENVSIPEIFKRQTYTAEGMGVGFDFNKL